MGGSGEAGSPGHNCGLLVLEVSLHGELERDFGQEHGMTGQGGLASYCQSRSR